MKRNKESKARIRVINTMRMNKDEQLKYDFEMRNNSYYVDYKIRKIFFNDFIKFSSQIKNITKLYSRRYTRHTCRGKHELIHPIYDMERSSLSDMLESALERLEKIEKEIDSIITPFTVELTDEDKRKLDNLGKPIIYVSSAK